MAVDVVTEIEIGRPRADVASYAADPDHATTWYANIKSVERKTAPPLAVGSQLSFVAEFLGRRLAYTYEVREHVPGERFVMATAEGPFPMETTYTWADSPSGGTVMTLRNAGAPGRVRQGLRAGHGLRHEAREPQGPAPAQAGAGDRGVIARRLTSFGGS